MTTEEFIAKYSNYESVSILDLIKDFDISKSDASGRLCYLKKSGVIVLLVARESTGKHGSIPATYKINPLHVRKQGKLKPALKTKTGPKTKPIGRDYQQEIKDAMKDSVVFTISDICNAIGGHNGTIKDALLLMVGNGAAFYIGQRQTAVNSSRPVYSLLKPKQTGVDFLISKMIGGTITQHQKGTIHRGDQRHPSGDCIKSNNLCGGSSMLHSGYSAASTHTGARRYD